MKEGLKSIAWGYVVGGVLAIVLGVVFIVWPYATAAAIGMIVGVLFAVAGIICIVNYFAGWGLIDRSGWMLANGIIDTIIGLMFIVWPFAGGWFLSILLGISVIATAVFTLVYGGAVLRALSKGMFICDAIISVLLIIIGIWMLIDPSMMTTLFGWFAIIEGIWIIAFGLER